MPCMLPLSLRRCSEFGLSHDSYKEFHPLMIYYSKQVGCLLCSKPFVGCLPKPFVGCLLCSKRCVSWRVLNDA